MLSKYVMLYNERTIQLLQCIDHGVVLLDLKSINYCMNYINKNELNKMCVQFLKVGFHGKAISL